MPADAYKYFRVEAREIVEQLGQGVLDIEKAKSDPGLIARVLRLVHTLKGAARVVKQSEIADQAHAFEDALEPYRASAAVAPQETVDLLLKLIDGISRNVADLARPVETNPAPASRIQAEDSIRTVRFDHAEIDELLDGISEAHAQLGVLRKATVSNARIRQLVDLLPGRLAPQPRGAFAANEHVVSIVAEVREILGSLDRTLTDGVEQVDRELRQVRETAERMRLVPVNTLFTSLELVARDAARVEGKHVRFEGRGGTVRLDAQMLGPIQSALVQLVRNAVAHGIEYPEDRQAAHKPAEGNIRMEVAPLGRRVAFRCTDDGRGLDVEAVRRALARKGLLLAQTRDLSSQELFRILLKGGVSTSRAVTEVSGRGIGLDVVREIVERLGGEVSLRTEPGSGITAEILVPLSVSSLEALLVEAAGTVTGIPLEAVRKSERVAPDGFAQTPAGQAILFNSKLIPFCPLAFVLSSRPIVAAVRPWSVVVVEGKNGLAAFGVDRLKGTANIVLRPLPGLATASAAIAGVSLNADGNPQLVLDPDGLVDEAQRLSASRFESDTLRHQLLVVDDSLTTRMLEQSILESAGYDVDLAVSGEEGLEKARNGKYALFLVDVEMPGIDGFTFIEQTRADPMLRDVPSILVTSRESLNDRKRGEEVGARGYVVKGEFNQESLLKRIKELVA